jgi:hypothetical protein
MVGKAIDQMIHKGEPVKPPQPEPVIKDCLTTGSNCPEIPDSSNSSEIPNGSREAFEAFMVKRYDPNREHLARNEDTQLYFDDETEMAWKAFQVGAEWKSSNTDSHFYLVANGYPCIRERVVVTRKSGQKLTARLAYKRDSSFRNCNNLHWLTDDDKFADVGFDPIVSWSREPVDAPSPSLAASDLAKGMAEKIRMKQSLDATGNPPKTLNAARDLSSQFWEEAYQIMISLFNSGLSVEQIKQELLSRLPEGGSSK